MRNASKLARYKMMQNGRNGDYSNNGVHEKTYPGYTTPETMPENRFRDRRGREHYDNGRYAPVRSSYDNGGYPESNRYPLKSERRWEIIENRGGEDYNDDGMKRIRGFSHSGGKMPEHNYEPGAGNVVPFFNADTANEWMENLSNEDGTSGPHWSRDDVKALLAKKGVHEDVMRLWVAMNAEYSDMSAVARKYGVDKPEFYFDMACARWLHDKDAVPDKLAAYYAHVVKH